MEGPAIHLVMTESLIIFEAISYLPTSTGLSGRITMILPFSFCIPCSLSGFAKLEIHDASLCKEVSEAYSKGEAHTMVHKKVKDSAGKHPAESSSLKHEGCLIVIIHLQTPCRQPPEDIS